MDEEQQERRKNDRREAGDPDNKLDAIIGMLTMHMTGTERDLQSLRKAVDEYFRDLDAHTHIYHHETIAIDINEKKESKDTWKKIKTSVAEKLIIFVLGALMSYVGALMWIDFADKINKTPTPIVQMQMPPKVDPNVATHP